MFPSPPSEHVSKALEQSYVVWKVFLSSSKCHASVRSVERRKWKGERERKHFRSELNEAFSLSLSFFLPFSVYGPPLPFTLVPRFPLLLSWEEEEEFLSPLVAGYKAIPCQKAAPTLSLSLRRMERSEVVVVVVVQCGSIVGKECGKDTRGGKCRGAPSRWRRGKGGKEEGQIGGTAALGRTEKSENKNEKTRECFFFL